MASKTKVTPQKEETLEKGGPETPPDRPLLDLSKALAKEANSDHIEDVLAMLGEMRVNAVETEEASEGAEQREEPEDEPESERGELAEVQQKVPAMSEAKEPAERTDDPMRIYLRQMGSLGLL